MAAGSQYFPLGYLVHSVHIYQPIRDGRQYDIMFRVRVRVILSPICDWLIHVHCTKYPRKNKLPAGTKSQTRNMLLSYHYFLLVISNLITSRQIQYLFNYFNYISVINKKKIGMSLYAVCVSTTLLHSIHFPQ